MNDTTKPIAWVYLRAPIYYTATEMEVYVGGWEQIDPKDINA